MSQSPPSAHRSDLDNIRYDILCGLMAANPLPAVDEAIVRRLLFSGSADIRETQVKRSLPSLAEAIGRDRVDADGKSDTEKEDDSELHNRQVQKAHQRLRKLGGLFKAVRLNNDREGSGRGYSFHHVLVGRFDGRTEPHTPQAFWAAKRMAIQVSPLGPSLEQTWNRVWWALGSDNVSAQPLSEWAEALRLSRATALRRLRELGRSDVGMTFEELPPEPRKKGQIGRNPKQYRISAELPPKGKLPDGASRHRERQRQEQEMLHELRAPVAPAEAPGGYMVGPNGAMVPAPALAVEQEDLPEEFFGSASGAVTDEPEEAPPEGSASAEPARSLSSRMRQRGGGFRLRPPRCRAC